MCQDIGDNAGMALGTPAEWRVTSVSARGSRAIDHEQLQERRPLFGHRLGVCLACLVSAALLLVGLSCISRSCSLPSRLEIPHVIPSAGPAYPSNRAIAERAERRPYPVRRVDRLARPGRLA